MQIGPLTDTEFHPARLVRPVRRTPSWKRAKNFNLTINRLIEGMDLMRKSFLVGAVALTLVCATPAFAGFATSVSYSGPAGGGAALVSPPPSALGDVSTAYQVWNESSGTLSSNVTLENNGAVGSYSGTSPGTPTTLTSGTPYGTTMVQLNPGVNGVVHSGEAIIMFSSKIVGIALSGTTAGVPGSLDKTDVYGAPGTTYPTNYSNPNNNRGILGKNNQTFTITDGGLELEVKLTANFDGFKELRVFTAGGSPTGVPEPASIAIWSLAGTFFAGRRWWRRRQS
jgi:hypothetical protein